MKVALVYDRVNKWGGAERVLLALHEIWPDAPLFTAVYDRNRAAWADVFEVKPSFLQQFPFLRSRHELLAWITPMAFESFTLDGFDAVISVTSAEAKSIITKPETMHVSYCLTPTRYLWSARDDYERDGVMGYGLRLFGNTLRRRDLVSAQRPDYYIAISQVVKKRIERYYHRNVERVIYPPVDAIQINNQRLKSKDKDKGQYYLTVARLVRYKRIDLVIEAFNRLGWKLTIIGTGRNRPALESMAKKNIEFVGGDLTDGQLAAYYQKARAVVYAGEEDFGIVSLEAQACGTPVICLRNSGMAETVIEGKTGELFEKQTVYSLVHALEKANSAWYDSGSCRMNAQRYSLSRFRQEMKQTVETLYDKYRRHI